MSTYYVLRCYLMPNVTISIPDKVLKSGREYARKHRSSLNALIRELLIKTVLRSSSSNWLDECFGLMDKAKGDSRGHRWRRDELYNV